MNQNNIIPLLRNTLNLSHHARIEQKPAGIVNCVYKLIDNDKQYAVKWTGADEFSGIDRFNQFVLQQQLAKQRVAPEPVWLSDDECIWVERWEDNDTTHLHGDVIKVLANTLAYIHRLPITSRPLNLLARWEHYVDSAQLTKSETLRQQAEAYRASVIKSEQDTQHYVLCHNDLHVSHILRASPPVVVDWEYSAMGNRFFDVASCAVINELSADDVIHLCDAYAEASGISQREVAQSVEQHLIIVDVTNQLWRAALFNAKQRA
ncbi:phosphotransferase [Alteromonas sp. A079]|uniref:phosphotransferase n=1 Tax=Alteromonas sp. A079 TaxID=3410268 RepID=UPI003B9F0679